MRLCLQTLEINNSESLASENIYIDHNKVDLGSNMNFDYTQDDSLSLQLDNIDLTNEIIDYKQSDIGGTINDENDCIDGFIEIIQNLESIKAIET